jgi:hypothetical protein
LKIVNNNDNATGIIDCVGKLLADDAASKGGVRATNHITYYDRNNVLQFLRITIMSGKHKYSSKISHTMDNWFFDLYKSNINYVKKLYCIGYSFNDLHINSVLYDWLSFTKERHLTIVNPHMSKIPSFLSHLFDQISVINMTFFEFLNQGTGKKNLKKIRFNNWCRNLSRKILVKSEKI